MDLVNSINKIPIRLTQERWFHITEGHSELAGHYYTVLECIGFPDVIYKGSIDELIAVKELDNRKYIVVVYKEINDHDGFIITAFLTGRINQFERREKVWVKQM